MDADASLGRLVKSLCPTDSVMEAVGGVSDDEVAIITVWASLLSTFESWGSEDLRNLRRPTEFKRQEDGFSLLVSSIEDGSFAMKSSTLQYSGIGSGLCDP